MSVTSIGKRRPDVVSGAMKILLVEEPTVVAGRSQGRRRPDVVGGAMKVFLASGSSSTGGAVEVMNVVADSASEDLAMQATDQTHPWRAATFDSTGGALSYSANQITVAEAGWYRVEIHGVIGFTGAFRSFFRLQKDSGAGFADVNGCFTYANGADSQAVYSVAGTVIQLAVGDVLRWRFRRLAGSGGTISASANGCRWTMTKVG